MECLYAAYLRFTLLPSGKGAEKIYGSLQNYQWFGQFLSDGDADASQQGG